MSVLYCKNMRCSEAQKGKPCTAAHDCDFFIWDIEKQKGEKPTDEKNDKTGRNLRE